MSTTIPRLTNAEHVPEPLRGAIVALGNFDGFHLGHQAVAGEAIAWARAEGRPAIIATFDPHPVRVFQPDAPWFRLTTLDQRQRLFEAAGADAMFIFEFDRALASVPAEEFVRRILHEEMGVAGVVTGDDFTFGYKRGGNVALLRDLGAPLGIEARTVGPVEEGGAIVSSTRIRDALRAGDCATAIRLLTRPFAIEGEVQHGDKNGRKLGFPTANIDMGHYLRPRYGVYAIKGRLADGQLLDGAANIGIRPSFDPPKELLEPHFFDFSGDLYGQTIEVEFHAFLRDEMKFDDMDKLVAQIARDCADARKVLA